MSCPRSSANGPSNSKAARDDDDGQDDKYAPWHLLIWRYGSPPVCAWKRISLDLVTLCVPTTRQSFSSASMYLRIRVSVPPPCAAVAPTCHGSQSRRHEMRRTENRHGDGGLQPLPCFSPLLFHRHNAARNCLHAVAGGAVPLRAGLGWIACKPCIRFHPYPLLRCLRSTTSCSVPSFAFVFAPAPTPRPAGTTALQTMPTGIAEEHLVLVDLDLRSSSEAHIAWRLRSSRPYCDLQAHVTARILCRPRGWAVVGRHWGGTGAALGKCLDVYLAG
ncbi:hypothetical protein C8F01DRAFT_1174570, partial [Mycena amicta]